MMKISPREAFLLLTHKDASRTPLIDALACDPSFTDYSLKILNDYNVLNPSERAYLINKMKHVHILLTQIRNDRFNSTDRTTVLKRCLSDNNNTYSFLNVVKSLTIEEQELLTSIILNMPLRMTLDVLTVHSKKFNDIYLNKIKDTLVNNATIGVEYIKKFPEDIERRRLIIDNISKRGGTSMDVFAAIVFSQEERSKLLKTIIKYKSYAHRLLVQNHYGPYLTETDKEVIIDSLLESKNFDVIKLVNENIHLAGTLKEKMEPLLVMGRLANKI